MKRWKLSKKSVSYFSPAKINLFLKVVGRFPDGYHEIETLMQTISLFDEITFSISKSDTLRCDCSQIPTNRSNLIWKAVDAFREETKVHTPLDINLKKRIPHEAGLGGGSGNAATTLWALNQLFNTDLSVESLKLIGAKIGSDVPFFFSSGRAYCKGRGDQFVDVPLFSKDEFWVVKPPISISTQSIYNQFNIQNDFSKECTDDVLGRLQAGSHCYFNDLEKPAFRLHPALMELKTEFSRDSLSDTCMTGSGSAFFTHIEPEITESHLKFKVQSIVRNQYHWYV
ncbi:MAG: 4-(cytidine 5'-diphospho)-2-C-methyl-D-erythritol kinase [Waddliaceae bacterium]